MSDQLPPTRGVIGLKTALILYAVLLLGGVLVTHGNARIVVALIVLLLAVKSWVSYQKDRLE